MNRTQIHPLSGRIILPPSSRRLEIQTVRPSDRVTDNTRTVFGVAWDDHEHERLCQELTQQANACHQPEYAPSVA